MTYQAANNAARRLAILRLLVNAGGGSSEDNIRTGLRMSRFQGESMGEGVRSDFAFLEQANLISTELLNGTMLVADITPRGLRYLAREHAPIDGVEFPAIGS